MNEQTDPVPAHAGSRQVVLHELTDVETVTNALAVYIDYMIEKHGNDEPRPMTSEWLDSMDESCIHLHTVEAPPESIELILGPDRSTWPDTMLLCMNEDCLARKHIVDINDAIRGTLRDAVELRQRIVKEWGYDPTHDS